MSKKPEEVEGSEARAADRGQPQGLTFFDTPTSEDQRYLGDPVDVEATVRDFVAAAHKIASDAAQEVTSGEEALRLLNALCDRYAGIFYGQEPSRFRSMPFNSPQMLGRFINERLGMQEPDDKAAAILFMNCANQVFEAYHLHMSGEASEGDIRFLIESAIDDAVAILLGLPATSDDE